MNREQIIRKSPDVAPYLELGAHGFFPLFDSDFITDIENAPLEIEERRFHEILASLSRYHSLQKKRVYLSALETDERRLFTKAFLKLVEHRVLDNRPSIH